MIKVRKKEESDILTNYLNKIRGDMSYGPIAKATGLTTDQIRYIYEEKRIPKYNTLVMILDYFGINENKILELAEEDTLLKYRYWDELYPDEENISGIRYLIREIMFEKGVEPKELAKAFEIAPSFISVLLNGKTKITYKSLKIIADVLKETPESLLEKMTGRTDIIECRKEFAQMLLEARNGLGYSVEKVAQECQMTPNKYMLLEMGEGPIYRRYLLSVCKCLALDVRKVVSLGIKAKIILNRSEADILEHEKWIRKGDREICKLEDKILGYAQYNRITHEGKSYDICNILVLILLALDNHSETNETNKMEMIYYLKRMNDGNDKDIAREFNRFEHLEKNDCTLTEAFDYYKDAYRLSFMEIARLSGYSKGYVSNRMRTNDYNLEYIRKVFTSAYMSYAYSLDLFLKNKTKGKKNQSNILATTIINELRQEKNIEYEKNQIPASVICNIIKTIFQSESAIDKYDSICKICNSIECLK